jgi:predicted nucleotidyltransferase
LDTPTTGRLLPRDYLATGEGLYFAVVLPAEGPGPVHGSLRYEYRPDGTARKLATTEARELLAERYPHYLAYSEDLDAEAMLVPREDIISVYRPADTPSRLEQKRNKDELQSTAVEVIRFFLRHGLRSEALGITGSLMLGFHGADSDIDMVSFDGGTFEHARRAIRQGLERDELQALDEPAWRDAWARRGCALDYPAYLKHEQRKYNKFLLHGTKVDISLVSRNMCREFRPPVKKLGPATVRGRVIDDSRAFDYPACYQIDHAELPRVYSYTATYTGQAFRDEPLEASGVVEHDAAGRRYLVVGTSREGPGEYIRVPDL